MTYDAGREHGEAHHEEVVGKKPWSPRGVGKGWEFPESPEPDSCSQQISQTGDGFSELEVPDENTWIKQVAFHGANI